jgi:predicted DsbA family dithiol-disulfide isomerase
MLAAYPAAARDKPGGRARYARCGCLSNEVRERSAAVHVEIWSDIACPWCYVGKRRFEAALASYEHRDEVTYEWRSFELDPGAPAAREQDAATHLAEKYGMSREKALAFQAQMTENAAGEGLEFRFDLTRGANTFDAHRIVHLAATHDLQDAMKERIMRAYLTEGELISDHATLQRLALEVGLPVDEVDEVLGGDRFAVEVRADERTAAQLGIHAVPYFVVDRAIGASGAHPPAQLVELLRQARAKNPPISVIGEDGETCAADGSGC